MNAPDSTPPDYAGLSKQEVAERLKNPTPDATATPRTIEQAAQDCLTNLECNNYGFTEACAIIASAMREVVERELTAAKAEIAALRAVLAKCTPLNIEERAYLGTLRDRETAYQATIDALRAEVERLKQKQPINTHVRLFDLVRFMRSELHRMELITDEEYVWLCADAPLATYKDGGSPSPRRLEDYDQLRARVADLENDLEKSKHEADDWHRAWETVTEQAKKEVAELEQALSASATKAAAEYGEQLKPLFAKVRELEADKSRLAVARGFIEEYLALGGLFNPEAMEHNKVRDLLMDIADIIDGNQLSPNGLVAKRQAAIDAARAGAT